MRLDLPRISLVVGLALILCACGCTATPEKTCAPLTPATWVASLPGPFIPFDAFDKACQKSFGPYPAGERIIRVDFKTTDLDWVSISQPDAGGTGGMPECLWVKIPHGWAGPFDFSGRGLSWSEDSRGLPLFTQTGRWGGGPDEASFCHHECILGGFSGFGFTCSGSDAGMGDLSRWVRDNMDPKDTALIEWMKHPVTRRLLSEDGSSRDFMGMQWRLRDRKPNDPIELESQVVASSGSDKPPQQLFRWRFDPQQGYRLLEVVDGLGKKHAP